MSKEFEQAKSNLSLLKNEAGNETKLKLYGLYKQATIGKCNAAKPGVLDVIGKHKWSAWNNLGAMSKADAEKEYINVVNGLLKAENPDFNPNSTTTKGETGKQDSQFKGFHAAIVNGSIYKLTFNRPTKLNSVTSEMYHEVSAALKEAQANDQVKAFCLAAEGKYFSAGNDLNNYMKSNDGDMDKQIKIGCDMVENFVKEFIEFKKPLIAFINGPAVGIAFTILGLFDMVIASDKATFSAPFTKLSLSPEGCSSYTFPKLMGRIKASEILLFNRKLNATQAFERNLVTEVVPHEQFTDRCEKILQELTKIPTNSLIESKNVIRELDRETLLKVNSTEMAFLMKRFKSGEFMDTVMEFMSRRSKI